MLMLTVLYSLFSGSENAHMLPKQSHGQCHQIWERPI